MAGEKRSQRLLFIFPHPDDESYGCGGTIAKYLQEGKTDVFLLTLTRGEASSQGPKLGLTPEQMGETRSREMAEVARVYGLTELFLLDFPDSGLERLDPRDIESAVTSIVLKVEPQVVVTHPPHGISGFIDHIVTHAAVKRAFVELREQSPHVRRLAMTCVPDQLVALAPRPLHGEPVEKMDCRMHVEQYLDYKRRGLEVQTSVVAVTESDNVANLLMQPYEYYRFFQERFTPPLDDLFAGLPE